MKYSTIKQLLTKQNRNFFSFFKNHIISDTTAKIDISVFTNEFVDEIVSNLEKYKNFTIKGKKLPLVNRYYFEKFTLIVELGMIDFWINVKGRR